MNSDEKYKKGGGSSCAVNGCTNSRRKLNLWKEYSMCEKQGQLYASCTFLVPYKFHTMPSAELLVCFLCFHIFVLTLFTHICSVCLYSVQIVPAVQGGDCTN